MERLKQAKDFSHNLLKGTPFARSALQAVFCNLVDCSDNLIAGRPDMVLFRCSNRVLGHDTHQRMGGVKLLQIRYGVGTALSFDLNFSFDDLRFIPLSPTMDTGTVLVWKKDLVLTPVVEAFHQHIKNVQ